LLKKREKKVSPINCDFLPSLVYAPLIQVPKKREKQINPCTVAYQKLHWRTLKSGEPLTMGYFDNFDNGLLNKYKKS
jgi:hypothetical protein